MTEYDFYNTSKDLRILTRDDNIHFSRESCSKKRAEAYAEMFNLWFEEVKRLCCMEGFFE